MADTLHDDLMRLPLTMRRRIETAIIGAMLFGLATGTVVMFVIAELTR